MSDQPKWLDAMQKAVDWKSKHTVSPERVDALKTALMARDMAGIDEVLNAITGERFVSIMELDPQAREVLTLMLTLKFMALLEAVEQFDE